ncbi:MAG: cytochrome c oxidase subunit 4 [Saprospiraceae bacterium]|jgi:cytochrome c oxidase subunit 4
MAGHKTYEESIKFVYYGLGLLAFITLIEVGVSLFGKGHIWEGAKGNPFVLYTAGFLIIVLSVYKAYFIIFEFMHLGGEVRGMAMSILLPVLLLVWGIIAFMQEGGSWGDRRELIEQKNALPAQDVDNSTGMLNNTETISLEKAMEG